MCLCFADHVVIIVGFTSCPNKERGAEEWSGAGAKFLDFGDRIWEGGCVDQYLLVESDWQVSQ